MGLLLGLDFDLLLGLDFAEAEPAVEAPEPESFGRPRILWPKRRTITAASFTIQKRQQDHIEAKVKTAITISAIGASRNHKSEIYAYEKTRIAANIAETVIANMMILDVQNVFLKDIAGIERKRKDIRDMIEIITMDLI